MGGHSFLRELPFLQRRLPISFPYLGVQRLSAAARPSLGSLLAHVGAGGARSGGLGGESPFRKTSYLKSGSNLAPGPGGLGGSGGFWGVRVPQDSQLP